jgi:hypothetical protein
VGDTEMCGAVDRLLVLGLSMVWYLLKALLHSLVVAISNTKEIIQFLNIMDETR